MEQNERRFAILINIDNASPKYIEYTLDGVPGVGITTYRRIYGDWTDDEKRSWKNALSDRSVSPIRQYSYTAGKNATDSATIVDTMDILYSDDVNGFCLVSNDSSFTELAQRLREARMFVMGVGEQKTPELFRIAYGTFRSLGIISSDDTPETSATENQETITSIDEIQKVITELLIENNNQNRPVTLARVGNFLTKRFSDFDIGDYGYSKLSIFLESLNNNSLQVIKLHGGYFAQEKSTSISKTETEKGIIRIIKGYNGHVGNLSIIHDELKKIYPSFDVRQHGLNRISSFIRNFGIFRIEDNMVRLE